jgi:hypothetical protein
VAALFKDTAKTSQIAHKGSEGLTGCSRFPADHEARQEAEWKGDEHRDANLTRVNTGVIRQISEVPMKSIIARSERPEQDPTNQNIWENARHHQ